MPSLITNCQLSSGRRRSSGGRAAITVKRTSDGRVSRHLHDRVQAGDTVLYADLDYPAMQMAMNALAARRVPCFNVIFHSSEILPGGSPLK